MRVQSHQGNDPKETIMGWKCRCPICGRKRAGGRRGARTGAHYREVGVLLDEGGIHVDRLNRKQQSRLQRRRSKRQWQTGYLAHQN